MNKAWWSQGKFWLGVACSVVFLFLAFRNVRWTELAATFRSVNWVVLTVAISLFGLNLVVRSLRWQVLLIPLALMTTREAFAYVNIGYMANNLLPLRAGEAARAVLLGRKRRLSVSAVAATIVLERLMDVLALVALALLLMLATPVPPRVKQAALLSGGVGSLGVAVLWWAAGGQWAEWVVSNLDGQLPEQLAERMRQIGQSLVVGLSAIRSWKQAGMAGIYSLLAWGTVCASVYLMMVASRLELPWYAALMVVVIVNFGAALPSSPGFVGVVHFLVTIALSPWGVAKETALGFAIIYHGIPFLMTAGLGASCLWSEGAKIGGVAQVREEVL